jgi:thioredoxin-dependent peroxiredoxin
MIEVGQKAPDFTLPDSHGNMVTLSSFQGKNNVVVIMYPGDDTSGCTRQLCSVRDNIDSFKEENAVVLAMSHEGAESHNKFIEKYGLKNTLLIDEGRKVIKQYDAIKDTFGHEGTKRSVIIVDKQGVIRWIERGNPEHAEIKKHLQEVNQQQAVIQ